MTEDDWRWHMYDTVSVPGKHAFAGATHTTYRSRVQIGSAIRMLSTTCVVRLPIPLSRYVCGVEES